MAEFNGLDLYLDTNILMGCKDPDALFKTYENAKSISVTLGTVKELDRLKTVDGRRGYEAREALRIIREFSDRISIVIPENIEFEDTVDGDILKTAKKNTDSVVITNDLSMATVGKGSGLRVEQYSHPDETYRKGYTIYDFTDRMRDLSNVFVHLACISKEEVRVNEYAIIFKDNMHFASFKRLENESFEVLKVLDPKEFRSNQFGSIFPKDPIQLCAMDAMVNNQINIVTGPAGSGKTLLALAKQFQMLEKQEISKIIIFVNPVKAKNSKEVGFYKGDKTDKLLQEGIGGILASKLGEPEKLWELISDGTIEILPISDIRGYEVPENASLYITEAQNLDVELMKLAIQRVGTSKVFIEGDPTTQLDGWMYEGRNNGMRKAIEVFSGHIKFGTVQLEHVYRSEIAAIAENMTK